MTLAQSFDLAVQHHQAGRLAEAEQLYRQILARKPDHADALHYLGVMAQQVGQPIIAAELIGRAIGLRPDWSEAHNNRGEALRFLGRHDEAIADYRRAIAISPDYADAHSNLGNCLTERGQLDEAIAACRRAIAIRLDYPQAWSNLGNALAEKGDPDEAIAAHRQAITIRPGFAEAHSNLGNALKQRGDLEQAAAAYRQAIEIKPDYPDALSNLSVVLIALDQANAAITACRQAIALRPSYAEAHYNLGIAMSATGSFDEAIGAYRRAIALRADYAEAWNDLGVALTILGRPDEAIGAFGNAISLNPRFFEAFGNLGNALKVRGQLDAAITAHRQAIALNPRSSKAYSNLGGVLKDKGDVDEAIAAYRFAVELDPGFAEAHSNLLLCLHYQSNIEPGMIYTEHCRWNEQQAMPLRRFIRLHRNNPNPNRRLRIGYVSPDFRKHPVSCHLLPLLANHDHERFEIYCYAQVPAPDEMTERLRTHADHWRSTVGLSDERTADLIRNDAIDILVDLAGHTAGNRLLVFARKPAPIQVTRQGYPDTTGMTSIDYRMTDAWADPAGLTDAYTSERLIRLPRTNWIYEPPDGAQTLSPGSPDYNEPIVFGSFNNFAKVNEFTLKLWGRILAAAPQSRLLLKDRSLRCDSLRQRVFSILSDAGVKRDRVEICDQSLATADYFQLYHRVAIALDPFPYHGTATTCDALWMGVPVITLAGQTHVSRVGVSLLKSVGLSELIATEPDEVIRIASELADDRQRLPEIRGTLRKRMERSPLMDAPTFARSIEAAYRRMWTARIAPLIIC